MKPLILITNDDGISSPGLLAAAEAVDSFADILISAPASQQTSMGRAFPRSKDMGIIDSVKLNVNNKTITGYAVHSSPAFSVTHGVLELSSRTPDLIISGVNYGENLGTTLTCSGTLGAILEGNIHGIPGIAFSVPADISIQRSNAFPSFDWDSIKNVISFWVKKLLKDKYICGTRWLNINIPIPVPDLNNFVYTRQSNQNFFNSVKPKPRDFSKPFEFETVRNYSLEDLDPKDDIYAVFIKKSISVTPIVHNLTAPALL